MVNKYIYKHNISFIKILLTIKFSLVQHYMLSFVKTRQLFGSPNKYTDIPFNLHNFYLIQNFHYSSILKVNLYHQPLIQSLPMKYFNHVSFTHSKMFINSMLNIINL